MIVEVAFENYSNIGLISCSLRPNFARICAYNNVYRSMLEIRPMLGLKLNISYMGLMYNTKLFPLSNNYTCHSSIRSAYMPSTILSAKIIV